MFKKFNFTGKKRLLWKGDKPEILANLDEISAYEAKLVLMLELNKYLKNFSEAKVNLELYQARLSIKKYLGKVKDVCNKKDEYVFDTEELEPSQLRLRVNYFRYILDDELQNDKWFSMLVDFGEKLTDKSVITRDDDGKIIFNDELSDWINDVCNAFSGKNKFINNLEELFKREE